MTEKSTVSGADKPRILIVEARYYTHIGDELLKGAVAALDAAGAVHERITVPGAFEIPAAIGYAVEAMQRGTGTRYVPSLSGDLDAMREQVSLARNEGIDTVMAAPMLAGPSNFSSLVRAFPEVAFFAHPALGGAARIAPALLVGKLFRLLGADVVIFPTFGGRFGYSPDTCRSLAVTARAPFGGRKPSLPAPAGGITLDRIQEILDFYGVDTMLLIGGSLLLARERLSDEAAAFTRTVAAHVYR